MKSDQKSPARPAAQDGAARVVDVRGLATTYRRSGSGPTVVYLHGESLTQRWLPLHQHLSNHADVVVPELPGFGDTPTPTWFRSVDDVVLHLDDLFEVLGLEDIHLVGFALGGWVAAAFAVAYPRRVLSLTLVAPYGIRVPGEPLGDVFRITPDEQDNTLFNGLRAHAEIPQPSESDPTAVLVREFLDLTAAARMMWNPRYDHRFDTRLARVECPARVFAAEDDRVVPRSHCERWAELLPDGRLVVLEGTDAPTAHMVVVQEPERLANLIADFITTTEEARR